MHPGGGHPAGGEDVFGFGAKLVIPTYHPSPTVTMTMLEPDTPRLHPDPLDDVALPPALELLRSVWAVDRALQEVSRVMSIHLGVTGPQRLILRFVGKAPGTSPKRLAEVLHLDPSTLTGHLQRLESDGLLQRDHAPEDGRRQRLRLTDAGRRLDVKTPGTVEAAVEQVLGGVDGKDIIAAREVLERLAHALRDQAKKCAETKPARPRPRSRMRR